VVHSLFADYEVLVSPPVKYCKHIIILRVYHTSELKQIKCWPDAGALTCLLAGTDILPWVVPPTGEDKDYILCNISLPQVEFDAGDALVASSMRINIIDAARAEEDEKFEALRAAVSSVANLQRGLRSVDRSMRTSTHSPAAVQALEQAISMLAELQLTVDSTRSSMSSVASLPVQDKGGRAVNCAMASHELMQTISAPRSSTTYHEECKKSTCRDPQRG
jgi:hypothetical protein